MDMYLLNENPLKGITWKFQKLRISAFTVNFGKMPSIRSIFSLLRCAPQIEILHIPGSCLEVAFEIKEVDRREILNNDIAKETIDAEMSARLVKTLKRVIVTLAKCLPSEMCFIEHLLSKATSLESLKVILSWENLMMPFEEACTSFVTYYKVSPQLKFVVISGMEAIDVVAQTAAILIIMAKHTCHPSFLTMNSIDRHVCTALEI
uniref:FBD domain-containing protein n=1 Tax=Leersia perrieri TaxID=77586 RepID=A0A0D9X624_9ORYZ